MQQPQHQQVIIFPPPGPESIRTPPYPLDLLDEDEPADLPDGPIELPDLPKESQAYRTLQDLIYAAFIAQNYPNPMYFNRNINSACTHLFNLGRKIRHEINNCLSHMQNSPRDQIYWLPVGPEYTQFKTRIMREVNMFLRFMRLQAEERRQVEFEREQARLQFAFSHQRYIHTLNAYYNPHNYK